jgi:hypothetical protein
MKQTVLQAFKPYPRVFTLVLAAWASIGMAGDVSAKSHGVKNQPIIRVRIYNYAHVYGPDLRTAEGGAGYLFARVGIRIAWTVYAQKQGEDQAQPEEPTANFIIRILPAIMVARYRHEPDALGQSLVPSGVHGPTPGGIANVFYDRVELVSSLWGLFRGEVLGDAIAHELGHLLLGTQHSHRGIMKADWTRLDLELASQGELQFSPGEVAALQRGARSLRQNPSLTVTAQR